MSSRGEHLGHHQPPKLVQEAVLVEEELEKRERFHRLRELRRRAHSNPVSSFITKVIVFLIGSALILAGIVMLVGPGQGILVILLGLGVLATEFAWAERMLHRLRQRVHEAREYAAAMDPAVRRRRILLTVLGTMVVVGAIVWALVTYGWPAVTVNAWNRLQSIAGFLPELPGM